MDGRQAAQHGSEAAVGTATTVHSSASDVSALRETAPLVGEMYPEEVVAVSVEAWRELAFSHSCNSKRKMSSE